MIIPPATNGGRQVATTASLPAPTGGWNARDPISAMEPEDALQLDNYMPGTQDVYLRGGSLPYATLAGVTSPVETLIAYNDGASPKLLACANGAIYDVTAGGAIGSSLASGFASNRWQDVSMGGYQLLFNGADTPQKYNGTAITANTITGTSGGYTLTPSNLISADIFGQRVFAVEKGTLRVWYLGLQAISGAASLLDFSYYCKLGGSIVAMGTWSIDGGNGPFDYAVFLTSMGEALVYQGTDPSNASTFSLVGVFRVGAPIGNRPLIKAGADLIIICEDGFVPLSKVMALDRIGAEALALSDKIRDAVSSATKMYKANFGWQAMIYPQGNWLLFNVPLVENAQQQQYVANTLNNSWCRFLGMDANCWALFLEKPFFGGSGVVSQADVGNSDNGSPIQGDIKTSFQYFASRARLKNFKAVRPVIASDGAVNVGVSVSVDYEDVAPASIATPPVVGALWDVAPWDTTPWSTGDIVRKNWLSTNALGYSAALRMRTITSGVDISLNSIDWLMEPGGVM